MKGTTINIGKNELVVFSDKLEKMGRSDLPVVVRQTLNSAAVSMRKETLPKVYNKKFTVRNKSFLRSRTKFKLASGFNVSSMESISGITAMQDQATQDLAIQETGGMIAGRSLIPLDTARVGKSEQKQVRGAFKLRNINAYQRVKADDKAGLMKAANQVGIGGHLIYGSTLFQVKKIVRVSSGPKKGNTFVSMIPLYDYEPGRSVKIRKNPFVSVAAEIEGRKLNSYFVQHAKKRLKK